MVKKPWLARTRPLPRQVVQERVLEPFAEPAPLHSSQGARVGTRIFACLPA